MVWTETDGNGKQRFLRKNSDGTVTLTGSNKGNLADDVPQGMKVIRKSGRLKLIRG